MTCIDADMRIEELASGEEPAGELQAHLAGCARCATTLANARAIEQALQRLAAPAPPANFAGSVLARVRRERWRSEQMVDWAFNIAVGFGALLILVGLGGLAWAAGLVSIGGDLMAVLSENSPRFFDRIFAESQTIVLSALLLSATLGFWWWAQGESTA
jgi:anti-sigma factor RsiW